MLHSLMVRKLLTQTFAQCEKSSMRLATYLENSDDTLTGLSKRTGIKVTTLHGYMTLRRIPNAVNVAKLEEATGGKVCARDHIPETAEQPGCAA
jgi:hypothetical protein